MFRRTMIISFIVMGIAVPLAGQKNRIRVPQQRPEQGQRLQGPLDQPIERLQSALDLAPDQVASLRPLMESHQQNLRAAAQEVQDKAKVVQDLQQQPNPDPTALGNAVLELRTARERVKTAQDSFETSFRNLLTQDQKAKLDGMKIGARGRRPLGRPGLRGSDPDLR